MMIVLMRHSEYKPCIIILGARLALGRRRRNLDALQSVSLSLSLKEVCTFGALQLPFIVEKYPSCSPTNIRL